MNKMAWKGWDCPGIDEGCQGARDERNIEKCSDLDNCAECYSRFRESKEERTTEGIMRDPAIRGEELGRRRYASV